MTSRSARLRSAGNAAYTSAAGSPSKLHAALNLYKLAIDAACNDSETASACKNAGLASARLAGLAAADSSGMDIDQPSALPSRSPRLSAAGSHYFDSMSYFVRAHVAGSAASNSAEWLHHCLDEAHLALAELMDCILPQLSIDEALDVLALGSDAAASASQHKHLIGVRMWLATWHYEHAEHLFYRSIKEQSDNGDGADWKLCLRLLAEAGRPMQLCAQLLAPACDRINLPGDDVAELLEELHDSIFLHTCSCNSIQCRLQAADVLDRALNTSDEMNMDGVYAAADLYKQAAILTKEHDLENEAIALSALGRLYDSVMSDEGRCVRYLKKVMELVAAMAPRVVTGEPWYQEACAVLQRYQRARVRKEEVEEAKRKEPLLKQLEKELRAIEVAANKGAEALLKHVYAKHPPRNPQHKLAKPTPDTLQDLLKTAIVHYHPDKQRSAKHEDLWCVLCEEITKELTRKYNIFTCAADD